MIVFIQTKESMMRTVKSFTIVILTLSAALFTGMVAAAPGDGGDWVSLSTIAKSVDNTVSQLATVMIDISLISGIGFIMASFFKFHQHKQNPQQVQMSQGVSLLLIGCGLTLIPLLLPTASVAVLGSSASKPAHIGGDSIHKLIGSG
jgi:intracellular multiplication protein IcmD